jgi:quercetin dioxygenase-like cupin family protein
LEFNDRIPGGCAQLQVKGDARIMQVTQIVKDGQRTVLDLPDGNRMEPLSPLTEDAYCVVRGTIPPHGGVPLHSHTDAESFYVLSGEAEALVQTTDGLEWQRLRPGDFIHIPAGNKHAWRNRSSEPTSALITCTEKLGRALREMAQFTGENGMQFPSPAAIHRLVEVSELYGFWFGTREENAAVGIEL